MPVDLAIERAARAIWRALHTPYEAKPWDATERQACLRAAQAAAQILQRDQIVTIPHEGRVS